MKRRSIAVLLAMTLTLAAAPAQAFAASGLPTLYGLTDFTPAASYTETLTVEGLRPNGTTIPVVTDGAQQIWYGGEQLKLKLTGATTGAYYLVYILNEGDTGIPTAQNVAGFGQFKATSATATFQIYPDLTPGNTYYIYLSKTAPGSSSGWTSTAPEQIATFSYSSTVTMSTGNVDGEGAIDEDDASTILESVTGSLNSALTTDQQLAADINRDGAVNAADAMLLLQSLSV